MYFFVKILKNEIIFHLAQMILLLLILLKKYWTCKYENAKFIWI